MVPRREVGDHDWGVPPRVWLIFATADPAHRRVSGDTWNENGIVSFCRRVDVCHISAILVYLVEWL